MYRVNALLEDTEVQDIITDNAELLEGANADFEQWYDVMVDFVMENLDEFLDENLEETYRNVYTFSTFATSQVLSELSHVYGSEIDNVEAIKEAAQQEFV